MTLTKEQIAYLFRFCEKHYVHHYDVQVELVDHLANAIELEMSRDERITFHQALDRVYAGFGVMGFAPIVREKTDQVRRMANKQYWRQVVDQLKWPQAVVFCLAVAFVYTVSAQSALVGFILLGIVGFGGAIFLMHHSIRDYRVLKSTGKKFLSYTNYHMTANTWFLYLFARYAVHQPEPDPLFLGLLCGVYLLTTIASYRVLQKGKQNLMRDYPEVFQLSE